MVTTVGGVQIEIRGDKSDFSRTMREVQRDANKTGQNVAREFQQADRAAQRLNTSIRSSTGAFAGLLSVASGGILAGAIIQAADAFAGMRSKINLSISAADDLLTVEKQLYQQAIANRAALEPIVSLYQRIRGSRADLSNEQTLEITDRFSKSLVISGASAQGAASATLQFSQAIAGGVLRAEEFNSIIESNVRFVKLLADNLGVSVGQIRNLVNEGAITSDVIFKAIRENGADLDAEFTKIPLTVSSALVNVRNAFTNYVGLSDQAAGTSAKLAGFINSLANDFDRLAEIVVVAAATIGGAATGLVAARFVSGLVAMSAAAGSAATAMGVLRAALAFFGGPIGLAVTAVAGAFAFLAVTSKDAGDSLMRAKDAARLANEVLAETRGIVSGSDSPFNQITEQANDAASEVASLTGVIEQLTTGLANLREEGQIATALRLGEALAKADASIAELQQEREQAGNRAFNAPNLGGREGLQRNIDRALEGFDDSERGRELVRLRQQRAALQNQLQAATQGLGVNDIINQFRNGSPQVDAAEVTTQVTEQAVATGELADETERLAAAQERIDQFNLNRAEGQAGAAAGVQQRLDEFNLNRAERDRQVQEAQAAADAFRERIASTLSQGLEQGIRSGNWGEAFRGILAQSTSDALSQAINDLASELVSLFSSALGGGGFNLGSIFGGGRAAGGSVRAGMRYMVGEKGPEMFVPTTSGMIVPQFEGPASAAAGGVSGRSISISAPFIVQGSITEEVLPRVQAMMAAQAEQLPRIVDARVSDSLRRGRY